MSRFIGVFVESQGGKSGQFTQAEPDNRFWKASKGPQHEAFENLYAARTGRFLYFDEQVLLPKIKKKKGPKEDPTEFLHFLWRLRKANASPHLECVRFQTGMNVAPKLKGTFDIPIENTTPDFTLDHLYSLAEDTAARLDIGIGLKTECVLRNGQSVHGKIVGYDPESQLATIDVGSEETFSIAQIQTVKLPIDK